MALIKGKQLATGNDGVDTANLKDSAVSAAKIASGAVSSAKVDSSIIVASGLNPFSGNQSMGGFLLQNLSIPSNGTDAANKSYVDALAQGLRDFKESCKVATTGALSASWSSANNGQFTATSNGTLTIDGVGPLSTSDRILVKNQVGAAAYQNGIYSVVSPGSGASPWVIARSPDANESSEVTSGMYTYVSQGTANAQTSFVLATPDPIVLNTTALDFVVFSSVGGVTAGAGLSDASGTFNVNVDGTTIEISGTNALRLASSAAGAGLVSGASNVLDVGAGAGITVNANSVEVQYGAAGNISSAQAGASASAGVLDLAARADHAHAFPTASAVSVGTANAEGTSSSFARADHVHASPSPSKQNKCMAASVTSSDGQVACSTPLASTPGLASWIGVLVNGIQYCLGDGVKTKDCYFSADGGTTAKTIASIAAGDLLYWNGSIAGFQLSSSDQVDFNFSSF